MTNDSAIAPSRFYFDKKDQFDAKKRISSTVKSHKIIFRLLVR